MGTNRRAIECMMHAQKYYAHACVCVICVPGVLRILDDLLAVLAPLVAVVEHVHVAHRLEAEPWLPQLPPHLPTATPRLLHPHRTDP
jgi:hypothetical protein